MSRALVVLLALAVALAPAGASADEDGMAQLYRRFRVEDVRTDYVVAVDTSLSMKTVYPQVVTALNAFMATGMQKRDRLTIIAFDNQPKLLYSGPPPGRRRLRAVLPNQPSPDGQKTDMGAAVETIIERIRRSRAELQFVFFLTDGAEDPPAQSRFATDNQHSWQELAGRAGGVIRGRIVRVHGIGLNSNTDVAKLKQVFPDASPLTVDPGGLSVYFSHLKEKIKRERLRLKVVRELRSGRVDVKPVGGSDWGELADGQRVVRRFTLSSTYRKLPVRVRLDGTTPERLVLAGPGGASVVVKIVGPEGSVNLPPGATRTVALRATVVGRPGRSERLKIGREREKYRRRLKLRMTGEIAPAGALRTLGVDPASRPVGASQTVSSYTVIGTPFYLAIAVGSLALMALAGLMWRVILPMGRAARRGMVPPALFGRLAFAVSPEGRPLPAPCSLERFGRRALIGSEAPIHLVGEQVKPRHAELYGRWTEAGPSVWLRKLEGNVSVARTPASAPRVVTDEVQLERGSVVELGGYRIQWV